jgi:hypothetical protein
MRSGAAERTPDTPMRRRCYGADACHPILIGAALVQKQGGRHLCRPPEFLRLVR